MEILAGSSWVGPGITVFGEDFAGQHSVTVEFDPASINLDESSTPLTPVDVTYTWDVIPTLTVSWARGDVHLLTFSNQAYDFQAQGEFLLTKSTNPNDSFQIQIRTAPPSKASAVSIITQAALAVGTDRVTFGIGRNDFVWIDGKAATSLSPGNVIQLNGGQIAQTSSNTYLVTWDTGETVTMSNSGYYVNVSSISLGSNAKPNSVEGLLGSGNGASNDFKLPDGTNVAADIAAHPNALYTEFGNAWRLTDQTSLLDYNAGQTTATFTNANFPFIRNPLSNVPASVLAKAEAQAAVRGITNPVLVQQAALDYIETGDPNFLAGGANAQQNASNVTAANIAAAPADTTPTIGIAADTTGVTELTTGATHVTFTVYLSQAAGTDTVVDYAVTAPDAGFLGAADFGGAPPSGAITIAAGQTTGQVDIAVPLGVLGTTPEKNLQVTITATNGDLVVAPSAQSLVVNNNPEPGPAPVPQIALLSTAATLAGSAGTYSVALGTFVQGEVVSPLQFQISNGAGAQADNLGGTVTGGGAALVGQLANGSIPSIAPGQNFQGIFLAPDTSGLGSQSQTFTYNPVDSNDTGYSNPLPAQTVTVTDNVIAAAVGQLNTTTPIAFGDIHLGASVSKALSITNAAASGAAALDVTAAVQVGNVSVTGAISGLAAGATDTSSLSLGLDATNVGAVSGLAQLSYVSDAANGHTLQGSTAEVLLQATAFREAAPTITAPPTAIVHVGDDGGSLSEKLTIANSAAADGASEGLRASVTGFAGSLTAAGTSGLIAAGASDASSIAAIFSTATSGVQSGSVTLDLVSDGAGIDSLGQTDLGPTPVGLSLQVDNYAVAALEKISGAGTFGGSAASGYTLNLGNVLQGTAGVTVGLGVLNAATGLADQLNGTFSVSGNGGTFLNTLADLPGGGLGAGQVDSAPTITLQTSATGTFTETVTLHSTGSNASGYSAALADETLTITGTVVGGAKAVVNTASPVVLGPVRVGGTAGQALSISNSATAPAESLDASVGSVTGTATAAGSINLLTAGSTDNSSISVGIDTSSAGARGGTVTLAFASDGTGIDGNGTTSLPSQQVQVSGAVYREATAGIAALPANFIVHVKDTVAQEIAITNTAANDGYSENLIGSVAGTTGGIIAAGSTGDLAAQAASNAINLGFSTAAAGTVSGTVTLDFQSDGSGIDGFASTDIGQQVVQVNATVDNFATAALEKVSGAGTFGGNAAAGYTLDLGTVAQGSGPVTVALGALNGAAGPADLLEGSFGITGSSAFNNGNFSAFSGLGADQADTAPTVTLDTSVSGKFSETITLNATGYNASGYAGALAPETLTITGTVGYVPDSWKGPASKKAGVILGGAWAAAADWSTGVPGPSSNAILSASAAAYTVTNGASTSVGGLTINGPSGTATATAALDLTGGTFTINGAASNAGTVKVEGAGALAIDGAFANAATGQVSAAAPGATIDLVGGSLTGGKVSIAAGALLEATGGASGPSSIGGGAVVTDRGTLEATNNTTLTLAGTTVNATISKTNGGVTGGIIEAVDAGPTSAVVLDGATVIGAELETANGGVIATAAGSTSTLNGAAIAVGTTVSVVDGSTLTVQGNITDAGTLGLDGPGGVSGAVLDISGAVTLNAAGAVVLADGTNSSIVAASGGGTLTNAGNTISGAGAIGSGDGTLALVNKKVIDATGANALTIDTGTAVTNSGTLEATGGSKLVVDDAVTNTGMIASLGPSSDVVIGNTVTNTPTGAMVSAGATGALVELKGTSIGGGRIRIVAGAEIEADGGTSRSTTISHATISDAGLLLATNDTTLDLAGDTITATGGTIEASDAVVGGPSSTILLDGTTIAGGTLETSAGGVIKTAGGTTTTLSGATIATGTTIGVVASSTLLLKGTLTNNGTIALDPNGGATLEGGGSVTLAGGGDISLANVGTNAIVASGATNLKPFTLTNASDTISGAGAIGTGDQTLKLSNQSNATIDADGSNTLTIHTGNAITNSGTLEATGSGGLVIDDAVTNSGTIEANGGNVTIGGNLSGSGKTEVAQIFSGSQIELKGTLNTAAVSFQNNVGNSGFLTLDHSATTGATNGFKGTLAGFYGDGSTGDTLDLQDINFASGVSWSFKQDKSTTAPAGVLTVKDGAGDTANITLLGQYIAAGKSASSAGLSPSTLFHLDHDSNAGTLVTTTFKPAVGA